MPSYFWIKLYHEILHDPKMGRLTDNLWRRVIEIFLLAGENDNDGNLPPIESMAWTLRLSVEELEANLQALEKVNIVSQTPDGWHVTHYAQRQAAIPGKERVSAHRDRVKKQEYYADETTEDFNGNESVTNRNTDIDIDKELDQNKSKSKIKRAASAALPRQIQTYIDAGGKFQSGTLADGTTKKDNAIRVICETVKDEDSSLDLWRRVVSSYCAQWSSKSYTVMLNEYYLQGRVPGQSRNGNGQSAELSPMLKAIARRNGVIK